MTREHNDGPNLKALKTWAQARGLTVTTSNGTQHDPQNVVAIKLDTVPEPLLSRTSLDSTDTAAMYLINLIDLLQLEN